MAYERLDAPSPHPSPAAGQSNAVRLRPAQLRTIARGLAGDDVTPFVEQARQHHPEVAAALGDELPHHVAEIRDLAYAVGLRRPSDVHRFVDLGLVMGWAWLQRERAAIEADLGHPSLAEPSRRLEALIERVLLQLEATP